MDNCNSIKELLKENSSMGSGMSDRILTDSDNKQPTIHDRVLVYFEAALGDRNTYLKKYVEDLRSGHDLVPGYKRP